MGSECLASRSASPFNHGVASFAAKRASTVSPLSAPSRSREETDAEGDPHRADRTMTQHLSQRVAYRTDGLVAPLFHPGSDALQDQLSDVGLVLADLSRGGTTTVCAALCHHESVCMSTVSNNNPSTENVPARKKPGMRDGTPANRQDEPANRRGLDRPWALRHLARRRGRQSTARQRW